MDLLEPVFKENHFQIWTGDFNALTREDYTNEQWNHITGVRKQNGWELPKTELTTQVSKMRMVNALWADSSVNKGL
jgi:predicted secreted protein